MMMHSIQRETMSQTTNYAQARTLHDDNHKNYYDKLQRDMQRNRTNIISQPTITKYTEKGNIEHEPPIKTTAPNYHSVTLNHSVIPRSRI